MSLKNGENLSNHIEVYGTEGVRSVVTFILKDSPFKLGAAVRSDACVLDNQRFSLKLMVLSDLTDVPLIRMDTVV